MARNIVCLIIAAIEVEMYDERATIMAIQTVPSTVRTVLVLGIAVFAVLGLLTAFGVDVPRIMFEPALLESRGGKVRFW